MKNHMIAAFVAGVIFAIGLGYSGMTQPAKVVGFLDLFGQWDPSLMFVMMGAIGSHLFAYRLIKKRTSPLLGGSFQIPSMKSLDGRLIAGAAIFGIGWGLGGFCPGPALASAFSGSSTVWLFLGAMILGMIIYAMVEPTLTKVRK